MANTLNNVVQIQHQTSGASFTVNSLRTAERAGFSVGEVTVGTTDESVSTEYLNPRNIMLRLLSGDDVRVGLDGSTYPFRLAADDDFTIFQLDVEGLREISTVTTIADVAGSLDGDYFTLEGSSGTWGVWYDVDDNGTSAPAHGMTNALEITSVVTGNSAILVADATATDMAASTAFAADFTVTHTVGTTLITLTDNYTGTRTNLAAGTSGFTMATTQGGAASPVIHMKSLGTSQVLVGVIPL